MPELNGRTLLREWRALMESAISTAAGAGGRSELPRELLAAMQRQLELVSDVVDGERRVQRELAARLSAPVDAAFDLLQETAVTLRRQAEALEQAGRALQETAGMMKRQAELFERAVVAVREPADRAKAAVGAGRPAPKRTRRRSA
jgi:hypothetical protein